MSASAVHVSDESAQELERLVDAITSLESITEGWDENQRLTVRALKSAIEAFNGEALRRLLKALKDDPVAAERLRMAVSDRVVYGALRFHGLVKPPVEERVRQALEEVRPSLHTHGGDIELVAIRMPDTVEVRLLGACHGCPASGQTLAEGVEKAIRQHCPEIVHIRQVSRGPSQAAGSSGEGVHFISPFALHASLGWVDAGELDAIPEGAIRECVIKERSVLLSRNGTAVSCFDNACAHLGMPLDAGEIDAGIITCRYHGFRYLLATGECLTAPEVQLKTHAVRVIGQRVQVRIQE
jgi:Fe-S cluster biogenesis protein NfuA/nitrite reductase/ring-hydroxylating ferredoxin subunit